MYLSTHYRKSIIFLFFLVLNTFPLFAQLPCGETIFCTPRERTYPYFVCEADGSYRERVECFSYDNPPSFNVVRARLPLAVNFKHWTGPSVVDMQTQSGGIRTIYSNALGSIDATDAANEWNCICPSTSRPPCEIDVCFTRDEIDFTSRGGDPTDHLAFTDIDAEVDSPKFGCNIDCSKTRIYINNTRAFKRERNGLPRQFFYTGLTWPSNIASGNEAHSLRELITHELGHALGMPHYEDDKGKQYCDHCSGIMSVGQDPNKNAKGLSQCDRCRFALLYCRLVCP